MTGETKRKPEQAAGLITKQKYEALIEELFKFPTSPRTVLYPDEDGELRQMSAQQIHELFKKMGDDD